METTPIEALATGPWGLVAAFLFGTLWGSFANVCIYRWPPTDEHPNGRSVVAPGSHCGVCGKPVRWYDNVPILSYLWLRGRCRDCKTEFAPRYLLVEAATGMLFATAWWFCVDARMLLEPLDARVLRFAIDAGFIWTMVVILFIDLDHKLILAWPAYPAIPIFYGLSFLLPGHHWYDGLIGAAIGYGVVRLIADGYYFLTKREGMGYGDGVLLALVGVLLGWRGVLVSLFLGSMIGVVIALPALIIARRKAEAAAPAPAEPAGEATDDDEDPGLARTEIPFGPFLATAAVFWLLAEPYLTIQILGR